MPKIVIKLNEDNNDELVCNTLYQELDNNEKDNDESIITKDIKKEEPKEEIKEKLEEIPKISFPKININLDNTNNDDYTCETFFIPNEEKDDSQKKEKQENQEENNYSINININNNTNSLSMNIPEEPKESIKSSTNDNNNNTNQLSNQELLNKYFIDLKFYRIPLIYVYNQKEDTFDINNFLTELKENKTNNSSFNNFDYRLRILNKINLVIKLEVLKNLSIRLFLIDKDNNNEGLLSTQYSFKKILGLYKIIRFDLCLPFNKTYLDFNTYNDYITKTFLNFIAITKEKNEYKFKMAKRPLGLCHSSIVINLYFSKVIFDIMVVEQNYCKIILSSENDDFNCLILDTFFDEESFNMLIKKEKFENNEIYFLENNDINNNELILELIKNLQKCFNGFCSGIVNVFDDMYLKANSNQKKLKELIVFKLDITDKLKNMKLTSCQFDNKICKVISIDSNLNKNKGIIYRHEISDLFGYETSEVWNKLFSYQKLIFSRIILRCSILKEENSIMALDKHQIIDEINFVFNKKVCNFCLIKIKDFIYIKFMMYESVGTFEFTKVIFLKGEKIDLNELKLINIKDKLILEVNKSIECINNEDDSLFSFLNID